MLKFVKINLPFIILVYLKKMRVNTNQQLILITLSQIE